MKSRFHNIIFLILLVYWTFGVTLLIAEDKALQEKNSSSGISSRLHKTTLAFTDIKTHNVGNMWLSVTNYGQFGSAGAGGLPSCEYPANSDVEYLFYGGCWIGAIVEGDTMVSVATDGANPGPGGTRDAFWPGWTEADTIVEKSMRLGTPTYDSTASSEQDFIAVYTDTSLMMGFDGFKPMGIKITQKSYAWSYSYAEDFVIFDFLIENKSEWVFGDGMRLSS